MLARETFLMIPYISPEQARAFQELFVEARRRLNMTQIQAAELAGVSQTLISTIERGPHVGMRVLDLFKVIRAYGIEPNVVAATLGMLPEAVTHSTSVASRLERLWSVIERLDDGKLEKVMDFLEIFLTGLHAQ